MPYPKFAQRESQPGPKLNCVPLNKVNIAICKMAQIIRKTKSEENTGRLETKTRHKNTKTQKRKNFRSEIEFSCKRRNEADRKVRSELFRVHGFEVKTVFS